MTKNEPALDELTFIAFDTETTGLVPVTGKLVELGAVRFRLDGVELGSLGQLIDPMEKIPSDVQRIHGITNDMVRGQPTVDRALASFLEFIGPPDNVLLAHNASFDLGFIGVAMSRLEIPYPEHPVVDTLPLSRALCPGLGNFRLDTIARALRVAEYEEHRALSDARLVKDVFLALLKLAPGVSTLSQLRRLSPALTFGDSQVFMMEPPEGFDKMAIALEEGRAIVMVYEGGSKGLEPRTVTPRALLESRGIPYLAAYCHADRREKMYRLDRIKEFWLEGGSRP